MLLDAYKRFVVYKSVSCYSVKNGAIILSACLQQRLTISVECLVNEMTRSKSMRRLLVSVCTKSLNFLVEPRSCTKQSKLESNREVKYTIEALNKNQLSI